MPIKIIRILIPMVIVAVGIFYYMLAPEDYVWLPKCPWWLLTGTYCPSCGLQRFFHALLNGHFWEAFCLNPFLLLSIPYATLAVLGKWYNINGVFDKVNKVIYGRTMLVLYVVLFFAWWIVRMVFGI